MSTPPSPLHGRRSKAPGASSKAEVADTGKPVSLAKHLDIPRGAANFKIFADTIKNVATEFFEMSTPDGTGAINYAVRRPIGVVAVICPWNLPLLLMT